MSVYWKNRTGVGRRKEARGAVFVIFLKDNLIQLAWSGPVESWPKLVGYTGCVVENTL